MYQIFEWLLIFDVWCMYHVYWFCCIDALFIWLNCLKSVCLFIPSSIEYWYLNFHQSSWCLYEECLIIECIAFQIDTFKIYAHVIKRTDTTTKYSNSTHIEEKTFFCCLSLFLCLYRCWATKWQRKKMEKVQYYALCICSFYFSSKFNWIYDTIMNNEILFI